MVNFNVAHSVQRSTMICGGRYRREMKSTKTSIISEVGMAFEQMKKTDRRSGTCYSIQYIDNYGKPYDSVKMDLSTQVVGEVKQSNFNRTKNFVPGVFSVNPIEHLSWKGTAIPIPEKEKVFLSSQVLVPRPWDVPTKAGRFLWGDLAANTHAVSGVGIGPFTTAVQPSANQKAWAINNAYAKLEEADFSTAVWLAELRETIEMLRNPLKAFRTLWERMFISTRKTSFQTYRRSIDDMASQWLEYRYGIMPVILDIMAIKKLYEDGLSRRTRVINRARKRNVSEGTQTASLDKRFDRPAYMIYYEYKVTRIVETAIVGSVFYRHNSGIAEDLALLGLNAGQIPAYLWELVTLSFVLDWAVGIGDWLAAICPHPHIDILGNCVSYRYTETNIIQTARATYYPDGRYPWKPVKSAHIAERQSTVRLVNQPKSWLPAMEPSVLNLKRSIDALALTWGKVTPSVNKLIKQSTKLR